MRAVAAPQRPAIFRPQTVLEAAAVGDLVSRVQTELLRLGYTTDRPDNVLGPKTLFAVMKFQEAEGFEIDAIVSEALLRQLSAAMPRAADAARCPEAPLEP